MNGLATLGLTTGLTQADGNVEVGIGQLRWDLNEVLPTLLHWLLGDNDYTYTYYNISEADGVYTYGEPVVGALGTKYTDDGSDNVDENGDRRVPVILNIYAIDKELATAAISDLGVYEPAEGDTAEDIEAGQQNADLVYEIVNELTTFATEAVEDYVAAHGNDVKSYVYNSDDRQYHPTNRGLNNLLVSLPQLINDIGQKFMNKYDVDSDWTFGEFAEYDNGDENDGLIYNVSVQEFKDLIENTQSKDVLMVFVDMFINNWLNAFTDFLNDFVSDEDNAITSEIPIVTSLLNSLDLFGETSVLTDVFNGLFLMTRDHVDSFTFETQENGYVGLSTLSAYFLLTNLSTIIDIVMNIVDANTADDGATTNDTADDVLVDDAVTNDTATTSSSGGLDISSIVNQILKSLNGNVPNITNNSENINGANALIDTLDSLLSTLLSNSYLNGYQLDEVDGILSGVVTTITNAFGENQADEVWYLLTEYLKVLNAGTPMQTAPPTLTRTVLLTQTKYIRQKTFPTS